MANVPSWALSFSTHFNLSLWVEGRKQTKSFRVFSFKMYSRNEF